MTTVTIPRKLAKDDDLVVIPRKEYEKLARIFKVLPKNQWWFWTKDWQEKEKEADRDIKLGRLSGPYQNRRELLRVLRNIKV